jgi:hypothetical protein
VLLSRGDLVDRNGARWCKKVTTVEMRRGEGERMGGEGVRGNEQGWVTEELTTKVRAAWRLRCGAVR